MSRDRSRWPAWSNVPTALVADPLVNATGKLVALALGIHTDAKFRAQVSRATLAETLAVSEATVKRGLRSLIRAGWLTVERSQSGRHSEVNRYEWNFRQAGLATARMQKGRAERPVPRGVKSDPGRGVKSAPSRGVKSDPQTNYLSSTKGRDRASQRSQRRAGALAERSATPSAVRPEEWTQILLELRPGGPGES